MADIRTPRYPVLFLLVPLFQLSLNLLRGFRKL
jgi:hypothetical protein